MSAIAGEPLSPNSSANLAGVREDNLAMKKVIIMIAAFVMSFMFMANSVFADYYSDDVTLKYGMSGSQVLSLQNDLKALGYFQTIPGGNFGNITLQSVIRFQKDNLLYADGIVGAGTAKALKAERVLKTARSYMGVPYVWGGVSPAGFDCSGFTHYTFLKNGIVIPRSAADQYKQGIPVARSNLKKGDLVFFQTYKPGASHVGIYVGNGEFIHASSGAGEIIKSPLSNVYYSQHYLGARRILN